MHGRNKFVPHPHPFGGPLPLFADELNTVLGPQPQRYRPQDLSEAIIKACESPLRCHKLSRAQLKFLASPYPSTGDTSDKRLERHLRHYLRILDTIFYFNLVEKYIDLYFDYREPHENIQGMFHGVWRSRILPESLVTPSDGIAFQTVRIVMKSHTGSFAQRLEACVGTLAHEMLHAFLEIYSCGCMRNGCWRRVRKDEEIGITGHGNAFARAAYAVEEAGKRKFGEGFDLNIQGSVAQEVRARDGEFRPTSDQMEESGYTDESLGVDEEDERAGCSFICCPDILCVPLCIVM